MNHLLELAKQDDWFNDPVREALALFEVETSLAVCLKVLLISEHYGFNRACGFLQLVSIVLENEAQSVLKAAKCQEESGMTAFDAYRCGDQLDNRMGTKHLTPQ